MNEVWIWEYDDGDYYSSGALRQVDFYYGSANAAKQAAVAWLKSKTWRWGTFEEDGGVRWQQDNEGGWRSQTVPSEEVLLVTQLVPE